VQLDAATVERLVEQITKEVLILLRDEAERDRAAGDGDTCVDCIGQCVFQCQDKVREVVAAGASRLTSTLGNTDVSPDVAKLIDHTLLKPDATQDQIAQLCYEARKFGFAAVCVNPTNVKLCSQLLQGSPVHVCAVVGFPLGATPPEVKAFEAQQAVENGASEIDMVLNMKRSSPASSPRQRGPITSKPVLALGRAGPQRMTWPSCAARSGQR